MTPEAVFRFQAAALLGLVEFVRARRSDGDALTTWQVGRPGLRPSEPFPRAPVQTKGDSALWQPSERYPDPAIEILDPSFAHYRLFHAAVERLATGFRWCEGPVWFGDGRFLLWSDIPNNRIMRWEEETGAVSVFRRASD